MLRPTGQLLDPDEKKNKGEEAEDTGPNFILVRIVNTKTSGSDVRKVVRGRMDTFHIVSYHNDRAGFHERGDGGPLLGDEQAAWVEAIGQTIASRTESESRIHKDISIPLDEGAEMNLLTLRRIALKTGQGDAFHDWAQEELKPALEAGGTKGVYFSHVTHGGDVNTCIIAGHFANWAELDGPGGFSHMSEGERDGLFANWDDMVEDHTVDILSFRDDLSY